MQPLISTLAPFLAIRDSQDTGGWTQPAVFFIFQGCGSTAPGCKAVSLNSTT